MSEMSPEVKLQTVWDTYSTKEEVYEALIAPFEPLIARKAKSVVNSRSGNGYAFDVWKDIFQETTRILLQLLCERYKQAPKKGGVTSIPITHINNAVIDAARLVIGGQTKARQASEEFSVSLTTTSGRKVKGLGVVENVFGSGIERLFSELELNSVIPVGEYSVEEFEEAVRIRSIQAAKKRNSRAGELFAAIAEFASREPEVLKDILLDSMDTPDYLESLEGDFGE